MMHYPHLTLETLPTTIVLANGQYPSQGLGLQLLDRWMSGCAGYRLVCCDGAVNQLLRHTDRLPDAVVGDLDSLSHSLIARLEGRIHQVAEQDTNDLTKTMHYVSQTLGLRSVVLLGASGGREDHALGNLALLPTYAPLLDELVMLTDHGHFRLIVSSATMSTRIGQQVSVFSFDAMPISLEGVHWPLHHQVLPQLWCGTLNRADATLIRIDTASPLLVYLAD